MSLTDPWPPTTDDEPRVFPRHNPAHLRQDDYAAARDAYVQRRAAATGDYATETREYHRDHGTYTLRRHLGGR